MIIKETDVRYSDWDDSKFSPHDLLVSLSSFQVSAGETNKPDIGCYGMNILYAIELNGEKIFSFSGEKQCVLPLKYITIHCLAFLSEVFIKDFDEEFKKRKKGTRISKVIIKPRKIETLYNDLESALTLIHLRAGTS